MKNLSLLFFVFMFLAVMVSCEEEKDSSEKFSKLTVEENKAVVQEAGIEFLDAMGRMKDVESIDVIYNLGNIIAPQPAKKSAISKDSKIFSTLVTFAAVAKGEKKLNDLFHAMAAPKELSEGPESILEFWNENKGTYTWNESLEDFDFVAGGTTIIFLFPSSDVSTTNDATFTISNYTGVEISNPFIEDYSGDFPASLLADLKVDDNTLISFVFAAQYNTDGSPKNIACDLTIETFKFEIDLTNTTTNVSLNYKFLENGSVILDIGAAGEGLFTEENYNDNTHTYTETYDYPIDWVYNPDTQQYEPVYTDEWQETDFEEIIHSANAHFQLFGLAIRGDVNVKGLKDQIDLIEEDRDNDDISDSEAIEREADKINEFLNLRLVTVSNNEILAKAEAYAKTEIDQDYVETHIDFRLTFADGSPIDVATYFEDGFEDFIDELNSFLDDVNADYDLGLEGWGK